MCQRSRSLGGGRRACLLGDEFDVITHRVPLTSAVVRRLLSAERMLMAPRESDSGAGSVINL
jgi:hypothetical protein